MVCIAESSVLELRVVNRPDLVEQIKRYLCCPYRLLFRVYQILAAQNVRLVEVHHSDVVKTAKDIVLNLVLRE